MIEAMMDSGRVVVEEIEPPEVRAASREEDAKSSEMSHSRPSPSRSPLAEEERKETSAHDQPGGA
jgi:hypothetical protein